MQKRNLSTRPLFALGVLASSVFLASTVSTLTSALVSTPTALANNAQGSYSFPGRAEDLKSGEYWYVGKKIHSESGNQMLGYDMGAVRFDAASKKWATKKVGTNGTENAHNLIYGKPVYAVADGEVVKCWRNAPENPRPGESHPGRTSSPKTIGGGGNALWVDVGNGETILYAHFKPGTIPTSLCPISKQFMTDASNDSEATLPPGNRPKVKRGQFIGEAGNSGASSGPHLHIHKSKGNTPLPLSFESAWTKSTQKQEDSVEDWTRLTNAPLPPGPIAILPDYSTGLAEIARHGVPASAYQFTVDRITKSGYRPAWIDGYNVNGKTYFNAVFRRADTTPWVAKHGLTASQYQTEFNQRIPQGFVPEQVESYLDGNNIRYAAIFVKKGGPAYKANHGKTAQEHQKLFDSYTKEGFIPVNISVVSVGGQRYYTSLYEKVNVGSFEARSFLTASEYQSESDQNKAAGRQLVYLNAYTHGGGVRFSAIWQSGMSGAFVARHGLSGSEYQAEWNKLTNQDYLTRLVTGYEDGNSANFAAVWRK